MSILMVGWPSERRHGEVGDAGHGGDGVLDLVGDLAQRLEVRPVDLDRVLALHARRRLLDVVLDVLREGEFDAGEGLASGPRCISAIRPSLSRPLRHWSNGFSGTKNSALKKPVESVPSSGRPCWEITVSASGKLLISAPHAVGVVVARLQRDRGRHDGPDPHVAFLELGQEFQRRCVLPARTASAGGAHAGGHGGAAMGEHDVAQPVVAAAQRAHRAGLGVAHLLGQQQGGERRRDREGGQQRRRTRA